MNNCVHLHGEAPIGLFWILARRSSSSVVLRNFHSLFSAIIGYLEYFHHEQIIQGRASARWVRSCCVLRRFGSFSFVGSSSWRHENFDARQNIIIALVTFNIQSSLLLLKHLYYSCCHHRFVQRRESRRQNVSVRNIQTVCPWFVRRQIGLTFQILIRRNIWYRLIWPWVNFIMLYVSVYNWHRRRHCFYSVRILFPPTVSVFC